MVSILASFSAPKTIQNVMENILCPFLHLFGNTYAAGAGASFCPDSGFPKHAPVSHLSLASDFSNFAPLLGESPILAWPGAPGRLPNRPLGSGPPRWAAPEAGSSGSGTPLGPDWAPFASCIYAQMRNVSLQHKTIVSQVRRRPTCRTSRRQVGSKLVRLRIFPERLP